MLPASAAYVRNDASGQPAYVIAPHSAMLGEQLGVVSASSPAACGEYCAAELACELFNVCQPGELAGT